ncbi:MAG: hypothetical protein K2L11_08130, partial [Muribaculaceae bacterium]|nr:hypothetical protein [Muribaculaceae bacterium]
PSDEPHAFCLKNRPSHAIKTLRETKSAKAGVARLIDESVLAKPNDKTALLRLKTKKNPRSIRPICDPGGAKRFAIRVAAPPFPSNSTTTLPQLPHSRNAKRSERASAPSAPECRIGDHNELLSEPFAPLREIITLRSQSED